MASPVASASKESTEGTTPMAAATSRYPKYERETEFFGIHPVSVVDNVINAVNDYVCDGCDKVEDFLLQDITLKEHSKEVRSGVDKALKRLQAGIDVNFDKFELYVLRNVLRLPEDFTVPEADETTFLAVPGGPSQAVSERADEELDQEIYDLQRQIQSAAAMRSALHAERDALDAELAVRRQRAVELNQLEAMITSVAVGETGGEVVPIEDVVRQLWKQVAAIRGLYEQDKSLSDGMDWTPAQSLESRFMQHKASAQIADDALRALAW